MFATHDIASTLMGTMYLRLIKRLILLSDTLEKTRPSEI